MIGLGILLIINTFAASIIIVLGYTSISIQKYNSRKLWVHKFEDEGFKVAKDYTMQIMDFESRRFSRITHRFSNTFSISKEQMTFQIVENAVDPEYGNRPSIRIDFKLTHRNEIDLILEKRGIFEKILGKNQGEYRNVNSDLAVRTTNLLVAEDLLTHPPNLRLINRIMSYTRKIQLDGMNSIKITRDIDTLIALCNVIIQFRNTLRSIVVKGKARPGLVLTLQNIEDTEREARCIICYQVIERGKVNILNCCGSTAHKKHIESWQKLKDYCPFCRRENLTQ